MDTSEYPSLPNLAQVHVRLAANSRRVETVVNSHLDGIERLFAAATTGDWEAIAQASRFLAKQDPAHLDGEVIRQARQVCDELAQARLRRQPLRHLSTLLEACRSMRRSHQD
jgi:hypothetical protein